MQYTIRNVPKDVDRELRRRAKQMNKSVNQMAIELFRRGLDLDGGAATPKRDFSDLIGKHHFDRGFDEAMEEFSRVDPEQWK